MVAEIRAKGGKTPMAIANDLNDLGLLTPKGNQWDGRSVRRLLGRQAALAGRSDDAPVGLDASINQRSSDVTAERPCKQANNISDPCGAIGLDLPNVV